MSKRFGLLLLVTSVACTTVPKASAPPAWFTKPPESAEVLYFTGDATEQPDEETARDTALQKALHHLLVYCGARIESEFKSLEVEKNGAYEQSTELGVTVTGEQIEVQKTKLRSWHVDVSEHGFNGYALVAWPKEEYARVMSSKTELAERALERYLAAAAAFDSNDPGTAVSALADARRFLGTSKAVLPLRHTKIADTRTLAVSIDSLDKRISEKLAVTRGVLAVDVLCKTDAKPVPCAPERASALRQAIAESGKKVSPSSLPAEVIARILDARVEDRTGLPSDAGFVVAVEMTTEFREKDAYGFQYVNYSARAAVLDVRTAQVVHTRSIAPTKVGHVKLDGAIAKGLTEAQRILADDLKAAVGGLK
ncbi:MAG: hypothetical protein HYV07_27180 [Deltaproteobacteria bacterium]|nr:hypothetical protein [Deltaproteobacteria bacterium]